ncbi:MAG: AarF/ABC1/UbiB kinase family protein [Bdellovibrionaceae bacterium]|nr:AarF/ABC1/UbiB kinase family protein [Pseudobdellovibrionaceae bacterium]
MSTFKKSVFSRSVQLLNTASKIAGHEVAQKIKESVAQNFEDYAPEKMKIRVQQAKILAESLSQLKGAAMKVGQLLSLDSSDILPKEVTEVLSQLQHKAQPTSFESIDGVLHQNLSAEQLATIKIDTQAHSAASIGQVHIAHRGDQKLALKVQYPGVRDSIHSDLAILKKVAGAFLSISGKKMDLQPLFAEFEKVLLQETDYERELRLMIEYKEKIVQAGLTDKYIVPTPYTELSTKSVLAMTFEEGLPLREWIDSNPTKEQKQEIAHLILDLYCREFFEWGLVQTDPNYGNFLVRDNSKLVLLDFGAAKHYEKTFVKDYCAVLLAMNSRDDKAILEKSINFKLIDPREEAATQKQYVEFMNLSLEPFSEELQPFHFADKDYAQRSITVGRSFTNSLKYSAPPQHIMLLHRKLGGIFNILRKMEVSINLTPYWKKML